jgi:hypothetical protein
MDFADRRVPVDDLRNDIDRRFWSSGRQTVDQECDIFLWLLVQDNVGSQGFNRALVELPRRFKHRFV